MQPQLRTTVALRKACAQLGCRQLHVIVSSAFCWVHVQSAAVLCRIAQLLPCVQQWCGQHCIWLVTQLLKASVCAYCPCLQLWFAARLLSHHQANLSAQQGYVAASLDVCINLFYCLCQQHREKVWCIGPDVTTSTGSGRRKGVILQLRPHCKRRLLACCVCCAVHKATVLFPVGQSSPSSSSTSLFLAAHGMIIT
jgi:hypothetical protein